MTKRQAKVAAALLNASWLAQSDAPDEIYGVSDEDLNKIIEAQNDAAWKVLHRYGFEDVLTKEQAVAHAIANY